MSRFVSINLAWLPALDIPARDYDAIYAARIAELTARLAARGVTFNTGNVDGDPLSAVEQAGAYRELVILSARDDAIRALLLATSWGTFLDHIGAGQVPPVQRKALVALPRSYVYGTDSVADWESDDAFRLRIQLGPEALSTCGSEGSYLFFSLSANGVKMASVYGPMSFGGTAANPFVGLGEVHIPIVASPYTDTSGAAVVDGTATADLCAAVASIVSPDERRPIGDFVTVLPATIVPYRIVATLTVGPGSDPGIVQAAAVKRLQAQANQQHRAGAAQLTQMLYGAAYVSDSTGANIVEKVTLVEPAADVNATPITPATPDSAYCAPFCTEIDVTVQVDNG